MSWANFFFLDFFNMGDPYSKLVENFQKNFFHKMGINRKLSTSTFQRYLARDHTTSVSHVIIWSKSPTRHRSCHGAPLHDQQASYDYARLVWPAAMSNRHVCKISKRSDNICWLIGGPECSIPIPSIWQIGQYHAANDRYDICVTTIGWRKLSNISL